MVSKNNRLLKNLNNNDLHQHFALRKLNIGVASVLIGLGLTCGVATTDAHAAVNNEPADQTTNVQQPAQAAPATTPETATAPAVTESTNDISQPTNDQQETAIYHAHDLTLTVGQDKIMNPSVEEVLKPNELHDLGVTDPDQAWFNWSDSNNIPSAPGTYHNVSGTLTTENKVWQILFPTVNVELKALPLQTVVGEEPALTINSILPASVYSTAITVMDSPDTKVEWVDKPDVSQATITPVKGQVKITYPSQED